MPRYLISLTQANAVKLEAQLGTRGEIVPSTGALSDKRDGAIISGLDAITEEEYAPIRERLATGGPLYHAGGPTGAEANQLRAERGNDVMVTFEVTAPKSMVISVPEGGNVTVEANKAAEAMAEEMGGAVTGVVQWTSMDEDGMVRFGGSAR
jgi:hypothetical protein